MFNEEQYEAACQDMEDRMDNEKKDFSKKELMLYEKLRKYTQQMAEDGLEFVALCKIGGKFLPLNSLIYSVNRLENGEVDKDSVSKTNFDIAKGLAYHLGFITAFEKLSKDQYDCIMKCFNRGKSTKN